MHCADSAKTGLHTLRSSIIAYQEGHCMWGIPVVGLVRGLHPAAEVLQVKPHYVIQSIHSPQARVQLIPGHLHLLPVFLIHLVTCQGVSDKGQTDM